MVKLPILILICGNLDKFAHSLRLDYADDYRLFCGDLGNEVNDDVLSRAFSRFPSFNMARVSFYFILLELYSGLIFFNTIHLYGVNFFISCSDFDLKPKEQLNMKGWF